MKTMLAVVGTLVLGLTAAVAPGIAQESLTVAVYGGEWGEAISKAVLMPFEQETGIRIVVEPGNSAVTLSKLKQQRGKPVIDAAWIDGGVSELALQEGLLESLDQARVPNIENLHPEAVYRAKDGRIFSLSTGYYAVGLVYNTEKVKEPPASYFDLWKPEFAGRMTLPSPANVMAFPLIIRLAEVRGGSIDDLAHAIGALKEARPAMFFDTSGIATNLFQSGEAIAGAHYASAAWYMIDKGLPIAYVVPREGALAGDIRIHVIKGTRHLAAAERLANYAVSPKAQKALAEFLYVAPSAKGVVLSDKAKARLPYGPTGSMKNLYIPDWQAINAKRSEITELFNKQVLAGR